MSEQSSVADELAAALAAADAAVKRLEHAALDAASVPNRGGVPLELYATVTRHIELHRRDLKVAGDEIAKALSMRVSSGGTIPTADGETLERSDGAPRKTWEHEQIRSVVAEALIKKYTDDGAITAPLSVILVEAMSVPSISSWKVKPLRALGISPDSYCKRGDGKTSFRVVDLTDDNGEGATNDDDDDFL